MSCQDSYPRPTKFYAETVLRDPCDGNCGINCSQPYSRQTVDIDNLGGSPKDVYVEARSVGREIEFPNSSSKYHACYGVPIQDGGRQTVSFVIRQANRIPGSNSDALRIEISYQQQRLNQMEERGSTPSNAHHSRTLTSDIQLRDP